MSTHRPVVSVRHRAIDLARWRTLLFVGLGVACGQAPIGPPELVLDTTACDRCGMLISEANFAAAFSSAGETRVYDDLGCFLSAFDGRDSGADATVWVQDFEGSGWLRGESAAFVEGSDVPTPMSGGLVAASSLDAAGRIQAHHGGRVVSSLEQLSAEQAAGGSDDR